MPMPRRIRPPSAKRLFRFVGRSPDDVRDDVQEEFAFHLEMRVDDLVSQGLTEAEARAQALREFGNQAAGADACVSGRSNRGTAENSGQAGDELWQDASFGARLLAPQSGVRHRRHPDARRRNRRQHRHLQRGQRAGPQAAAGARAGRSRAHLYGRKPHLLAQLSGHRPAEHGLHRYRRAYRHDSRADARRHNREHDRRNDDEQLLHDARRAGGARSTLLSL